MGSVKAQLHEINPILCRPKLDGFANLLYFKRFPDANVYRMSWFRAKLSLSSRRRGRFRPTGGDFQGMGDLSIRWG
jgi:hypothetical protein